MVNDTVIFYTLLVVFIGLGLIIPLTEAEFGESVSEYDINGIEDDIAEQGQTMRFTTVTNVIFSVVTMFFWTFGSIPIMIDLIVLLPLRIVFFLILAKLVRGTSS